MKSPLSSAVAAMPWRSATAAVLLALAGAASAAPTVSYTVFDLVDTTMGEDLQQYQYTLTGPIDVFGGITLFFDSSLFGTLSNLTTSDPVLDTTTPPTPPNAGLREATVTLPISGLAAGSPAQFSIDFIRLGGAPAPGAQLFDAFDAGGNSVFTTLPLTMPAGGGPVPLPEPGSLVLSAAALMAAVTVRRGASRRR